MMHKRKYDPFWKRVYSIRNYLHPYAPDDKQCFTVDFHAEKIVYKELMERARRLMATYSQR
jgi:hypothetical protein